MGSKHKYLAKNVVLFSLSNFVPKLLAIVLIPIYTSYLSTAQYGVSDLITTTVSLLIPILTLDIQDGVLRFALDNRYEKEDVFSIALRVILTGSLIVGIGAFILSLFDVPALKDSYLLFFVLMFVTTSLYNTVSLFCRGIDKVGVMTVCGIAQSVVMLVCNVLFLTHFHWGLTGYLLASTLGSVVALIICFFGAKLYKYVRIKTTKGVFKDMAIFSLPLIFSAVAWWVNNASDRYIISYMSGIAVSGLYAVSYKIPNILSMFQNVFAQAWSISAIKEFDKNDSDCFIAKTYNMMNFAMVFICSALMIANVPIAKLLYSNDFFRAWNYVPPLLISVVFNAMALFIGSIFTAVKDTKTLAISTIAGAIVNTVCNFVFIYYFGAFGAAMATLLGYMTVFGIRHLFLRRHVDIYFSWVRDMAVYAALFVQMVFCSFQNKFIWVQLILFASIIALYYYEICSLIHTFKKKILRKK